MILNIYVPATDDLLGIMPGSGIVGSSALNLAQPTVRIDYEGGKFDQPTFERPEVRLMHAADRHTWQGRGYPTIARQWLPADLLKAVGTYDTDTWRIVEITDQAAFDAWNARYGEHRAHA